MHARKFLTIAIMAIVLALTADLSNARRSGGSSSRSSSYSSIGYGGGYSYGSGRSSYANTVSYGSYGGNVVIIAGANGSYYYGTPSQCPYGCAVGGQCGTEAECTTSAIVGTIFLVIFFICFFGIFCCVCCVFCCAATQASGSHHSSHHSHHSHHSHEHVEPLMNIDQPPIAQPMMIQQPYMPQVYDPNM